MSQADEYATADQGRSLEEAVCRQCLMVYYIKMIMWNNQNNPLDTIDYGKYVPSEINVHSSELQRGTLNINFTRDIFSVINRIEWVILIIQHNHFIGINHDKLPKND